MSRNLWTNAAPAATSPPLVMKALTAGSLYDKFNRYHSGVETGYFPFVPLVPLAHVAAGETAAVICTIAAAAGINQPAEVTGFFIPAGVFQCRSSGLDELRLV